MTILFLISSGGYYGAENQVVTLAKSLSGMGCSCVLGVFCDAREPHTEIAEEAARLGLQVELIPCKGRFDWRAILHIRRLLRKYRADILHPQGYKSDSYAYVSALGLPCGMVATSHNWPSTVLSMRAYAAMDRQILRKFDRVIVLSTQVRDRLLRAGVARKSVGTISNGVDMDRFRNCMPTLRTELQNTGPVIGVVGRLVKEKGGEVFLHAAQQVMRTQRQVTFVFVGDGPCRQSWQELAVNLGIAEKVVFTGLRIDMPQVYASFDVVVLPSLVEAMPMCLLEAMAAGKPVIASSVGSIPEMITHGETGLLVAPGDANTLAHSILNVLDNGEFARRLGGSAQEAIAKRHSADVMARNYLEVYRDVIQSNIKSHPQASRAHTA